MSRELGFTHRGAPGGYRGLAQRDLADVPIGYFGASTGAAAAIVADKHLEIVGGATHLFEEPGTLGQAAELALAWFDRYLVA